MTVSFIHPRTPIFVDNPPRLLDVMKINAKTISPVAVVPKTTTPLPERVPLPTTLEKVQETANVTEAGDTVTQEATAKRTIGALVEAKLATENLETTEGEETTTAAATEVDKTLAEVAVTTVDPALPTRKTSVTVSLAIPRNALKKPTIRSPKRSTQRHLKTIFRKR